MIYHLTDEERADLEQAVKEADEGLFASEEEVRALFERLGPPPGRSGT